MEILKWNLVAIVAVITGIGKYYFFICMPTAGWKKLRSRGTAINPRISQRSCEPSDVAARL